MKRRILIFSFAYAPLIGGAEIAVRELTDRLSRDFEFDLVTIRPPGAPRAERIGAVDVHRVGSLSLPGGRYLYPFLACARALRLHRARRYDAIWSIMAAYAGFAALFFSWLRPRVPFLLTLQEGDPPEHIARRARIAGPLFSAIFRRANRVQAISSYLAAWATEQGARTEPLIIGNGADVNRFGAPVPDGKRQDIRRQCDAANRPLIVTASRLVRKNAVDVLIEALVRLADANAVLAIAGDGPERASLQALAKARGVADRTRFLGAVPHGELPALFAAADVFARPSRSEGFGNVFAEAMAAGTPVVATAAGGIPDIVKDGETGLVCRIDDAADCADKIRRLLSDRALAQRLAANGRTLVARDFDWDRIAARMAAEALAPLFSGR